MDKIDQLRKQLHDYIDHIEDENSLVELKNVIEKQILNSGLINEESEPFIDEMADDFWIDLDYQQKVEILVGIKQLEAGMGVSLNEMKTKIENL